MHKSIFLKKRAQTGTEYLIIVGFVTFAIMAIVVIAFTMSNNTKDKLKMNQIESFANSLIGSSESVFFAGEPSKVTVTLFLPEGANNVTINPYEVIIEFDSSTGKNSRVFGSRVPLSGTISGGEGAKNLVLEAKEDYVLITQN